jgi:two-component system sensor histidine kinase PilS (NtrC family)
MIEGTLSRRLLFHIALRLVSASVLLGIAWLIHLRAPGILNLNPFYVLIASIYAVSLVFIATLRFVDRFPWLIDVHFAIDVMVVSAAVALTGGITSIFTSLYALPIVAASILQFRRGSLQVAALSAVLYAGVVLAQYAEVAGMMDPLFGYSFDDDLPNVSVAQYTVGLNVAGLFAVAFLSGSLAERLRRVDVKLEKTSGQLADLQFFNDYVIHNLVSGLATADAVHRVLTFNQSAVQITGYEFEKVTGRPIAEVLRLPAEFMSTLDADLRRSRSKRAEVQYRRTDGRFIDLGLSVAQMPMPNGQRGYLYTFQDVTESKRLDRGAQMQKRLAAVGEMAAGIAHEIRNPLAAMSGSMQILRQELSLSSDQAQLMDIVLRESERLNATIRSFLAYARPQHFELLRLDLRTVVQDTATLLRNSTEIGERHTVHVETPADEVMIEADENHIRQIVWNLATNGLRAMPDGGRLRLRVAHELVEGVANGILTVTDEGVGMNAEEAEGLFQPFRGSFSKGSGLGLAIVRRITSDYGARVEVQSQVGQGATFRVCFPPVRGRRQVSQQESADFIS